MKALSLACRADEGTDSSRLYLQSRPCLALLVAMRLQLNTKSLGLQIRILKGTTQSIQPETHTQPSMTFDF